VSALQVRRAEMEAEQKRHDELKRQAESAQEAERAAKYQLALAREEERKMVRSSHCAVGPGATERRWACSRSASAQQGSTDSSVSCLRMAGILCQN
jgi:hypothetical protein